MEGPVHIDGLHISIDTDNIPDSPSFDVTAAQGFYMGDTALTPTTEAKISNVHVSGYYQKLPNHLGRPLNAGNFRDWRNPQLPPADTADQTAGPGSKYYRNCTMYGNNP